MADVVDIANDLVQRVADLSVSECHTKSNELDAVATGSCLYCAVRLPAVRRWCDAECRDAWENERGLHAKF